MWGRQGGFRGLVGGTRTRSCWSSTVGKIKLRCYTPRRVNSGNCRLIVDSFVIKHWPNGNPNWTLSFLSTYGLSHGCPGEVDVRTRSCGSCCTGSLLLSDGAFLKDLGRMRLRGVRDVWGEFRKMFFTVCGAAWFRESAGLGASTFYVWFLEMERISP